jgi:hypothetical protein
VAVITVVDDVAPVVGRTGVEEEPLAGRFEPVDRLFDAEGRRRMRGQHDPGVRRTELCIAGMEQGEAVAGFSVSLDERILAAGQVSEEMEVVVELLHLEYGLVGGQLVDGVGLSADQLPFGQGTVVVVGPVGGQIPVPPLTGFGDTPTLAEGFSPLRAMVQLVAQASLQEVG